METSLNIRCTECNAPINCNINDEKVICEYCGQTFFSPTANKDLLIAADCPACGAEFNFLEGTNFSSCDYCGSSLLITGKHSVKSFYIDIEPDIEKIQNLMFDEYNLKIKNNLKVEKILLPFWRYKARIYQAAGHKLKNIVVDFANPDSNIEKYIKSLIDLRVILPELKIFDRNNFKDEIILPPIDSIEQNKNQILEDKANYSVYFRKVLCESIGESESLIYVSFYIIWFNIANKNKILLYHPVFKKFYYEFVSNDEVFEFKGLQNKSKSAEFSNYTNLKIKLFTCPSCGEKLKSMDYEIVTQCECCYKMFTLYNDELFELPVTHVAPPLDYDNSGENYKTILTPYWKITLDSDNENVKFIINYIKKYKTIFPFDKEYYIYVPAYGKYYYPTFDRSSMFLTRFQPEFKKIQQLESLDKVKSCITELSEAYKLSKLIIYRIMPEIILNIYHAMCNFELSIVNNYEIIAIDKLKLDNYIVSLYTNYNIKRNDLLPG